MPKSTKSTPKFTITPKIASYLMRIEAAKQAMQNLPITPSILASLRETAPLFSMHYSTMIEGNRLTQEQVAKVIEDKQHFPGRERDEKEVLGYYAALEKLEQLTASQTEVTETHIQTYMRW
jgi:Fic family protein